jgi:hypothetical protein
MSERVISIAAFGQMLLAINDPRVAASRLMSTGGESLTLSLAKFNCTMAEAAANKTTPKIHEVTLTPVVQELSVDMDSSQPAGSIARAFCDALPTMIYDKDTVILLRREPISCDDAVGRQTVRLCYCVQRVAVDG